MSYVAHFYYVNPKNDQNEFLPTMSINSQAEK